MFGNIRSFLAIIFVLVILLSIGLPSLISEYRSAKESLAKIDREIEVKYDIDEYKDLSIVDGEEVVGMVPFAIRGEYTLVVDGIVIQEGSDLDYVTMSGVVSRKYKIDVVRNPVTKEVTVHATYIP